MLNKNNSMKYFVSTVLVTSLTFSSIVAGSAFANAGQAGVDTAQNNTAINEQNTEAVTVSSALISKGDTGESVAIIQNSLNNHGANLKQDGIFGPNTENAVENFQQSNSLSVDGIVGPNTTEALTGNTNAQTEDSNDTIVKGVSNIDESTASQSDAASIAQSLVGSPYVSGGTTPAGFDSSGFINYVFEQVGVSLDRTHEGMWANNGVHTDNPEIGDVVFFTNTYNTDRFATHSGVYIGNNQMIHAGTSETGVEVADLSIDYWQDRYIGAKSFI